MADDQPKPSKYGDASEAYLQNIARDMQALRSMLTEVVNYMKDAESEIPEKMRRFMMYFHDVHDIKYMYEEHGQHPPDHVMREIERCDDRYRHLLEDLNLDTGAFERVRQEMSKRAGNRWDHSRLLPKEKQT
jgi:septation ring formation regulator EzrA